MLGFLLWWMKKKNRKDEEKELEFNVEINIEFKMLMEPTRFSYHELTQSTNNFAEDEKLGEGGFGGVYCNIPNSFKLNKELYH